MTQFIETLVGIFQSSGFAKFGEPGGWLYAVMICVGCFRRGKNGWGKAGVNDTTAPF